MKNENKYWGNFYAFALKETLFWAKIQKRFDICKWGFPNWDVQNFNI
jgi:hypothetical protein